MTESHEHESIQFDLSKQLKEKIRDIFYDHKNLNFYFGASHPSTGTKTIAIKSKVETSSMRTTLERFDKKVDGVFDTQTKLLCVYSIKFNLRKYVKFDEDEQKWYSETYPDDPSFSADATNPGKEKEKEEAGGGIRATGELVLDAIKNHYQKLFVDEYQNPHIA